MSVGILLVSHQGVASTMLHTATRIWHEAPIKTDYIEVEFDADIKQTVLRVEEKLSLLDEGDGVLVLTDLVGATPCNLVSSISHPNTVVVSGLNLPMLIRTHNYADRELNELAFLAVEGGQRGIARLSQTVCDIITGA
jgi:PTS system ascorbate-specific IIA component